MSGQIRIGRCIYSKGGQRTNPSYPGFTNIVVLSKSTEYGSLSPFLLKDEKGRLLENVYQFQKVYEKVPATTQRYSRWDPTVIWSNPAETHAIFSNGIWNLLPAYFEWRQRGMNNPYPIRYPVGYYHRHKCLFALKEGSLTQLDYIQSRIEIYMPLYMNSVKKEPQFAELKQRLQSGENLLIIDVDGPHQESLSYYQEKCGVSTDFIDQNSIVCTKENMAIMLNDPKHPFRHGYCLGVALLNWELSH